MGKSFLFQDGYPFLAVVMLCFFFKQTVEQVPCVTCTSSNRKGCCEKHKRCCDSDDSLGLRQPGICPPPISGNFCAAKCAADSECPLGQRCCRNGKSIPLVCAAKNHGACPTGMYKSGNYTSCVDDKNCTRSQKCCPDRTKAGCCREQIPVTTTTTPSTTTTPTTTTPTTTTPTTTTPTTTTPTTTTPTTTAYSELWGVVGTDSTEGEWRRRRRRTMQKENLDEDGEQEDIQTSMEDEKVMRDSFEVVIKKPRILDASERERKRRRRRMQEEDLDKDGEQEDIQTSTEDEKVMRNSFDAVIKKPRILDASERERKRRRRRMQEEDLAKDGEQEDIQTSTEDEKVMRNSIELVIKKPRILDVSERERRRRRRRLQKEF